MAWSTRQLAELAGTTLKAVRHYHEIGLLDEPRRASNGYKKYEVPHLVRLLQIKRLSDLGVPLAQIATMGRADQEPDEAIRVLDTELAATIERLQRIRGELAILLRHRAPVDVPSGFGPVADGLSEADRAMIMISSRVFDEGAMRDLQTLVQGPPSTADEEFQSLAADADAATIQRVGEMLAPIIRQQQTDHPWLTDPGSRAPRGEAFAKSTVVQAMAELYNPAQLRALQIVNEINQQGKE